MTDTICAISTALGIGAISIIRVSGPDAIEIVNSIFKGSNLLKVATHTINYGFIVDKNEVIDEVLVSVMKSPKTYTTEDIVEVNCHGGIASTKKVYELLLKTGCREAEGGEFTKRAFLNGRIDLVEAEGINELLTSKSEAARKMALAQVSGKLSTLIRECKQKTIEISANIEVNIDYPEYEDEIVVTNELLQKNLVEIKQELEKILKNSKNGKLIKEGINIALVGRPNVGKSSILNAFLEEEKAIVSEVAGTTRDIIEGNVILNGITLNLIDTAGIRETEDLVEKIGVRRSVEQIEKADLVVLVLANDEELVEEDLNLYEQIKSKLHLILINKTDLDKKIIEASFDKSLIVYGNALKDNGLDELKSKIIELFNLEKLEKADFTYMSNARQIALIEKALENINHALEQSSNDIPVDLIAIDIEACRNALGEIIGETYKEELLEEMFSKFCLGK